MFRSFLIGVFVGGLLTALATAPLPEPAKEFDEPNIWHERPLTDAELSEIKIAQQNDKLLCIMELPDGMVGVGLCRVQWPEKQPRPSPEPGK